MRIFCENLVKNTCKNFGEKNAKIFRKNYEKEIINNDIIKLLMLSSQSRKFYKFLAQLIVAATPFMVFAKFFFREIFFSRNFALFSYFYA